MSTEQMEITPGLQVPPVIQSPTTPQTLPDPNQGAKKAKKENNTDGGSGGGGSGLIPLNPGTSGGSTGSQRQTPEQIKASVATMVGNLGKFYNAVMTKIGLTSREELLLIQNSHAVERVLLAATDTKRTAFQKKKNEKDVKDGKASEIDHDKTGAVFYSFKLEGQVGWYHARREVFDKEEIVNMYKTIMGGNGFNGLNHIMLHHSQMNDTCFQRSKALRSVGLDTSLISTFSGSTLPRRSGATGVAVKGGGTMVAEAIRFINRSIKERGLFRDLKAKTAYEKILLALKEKCATPQQKAVVEQVLGSRTPGAADIEDLVLLARSFILVRPSVSNKAAFPISMYLSAAAMGLLNEGYSMVGIEAFSLFNRVEVISLLRNGDVVEDKAQMFLMSCFGAAYEDLRVLSALANQTFKPRSQLKSKGFYVPQKEQGEKMAAGVLGVKFLRWAPMTRSGGNEVGGDNNSGQIGCSPAFAMERPIAVSMKTVRKMMAAGVNGRDADVKGNLLKMMQDMMSKKSVGNAFVGKKMYNLSDTGKAAPLEVKLGNKIPSFFFGRDEAEDYDDLRE